MEFGDDEFLSFEIQKEVSEDVLTNKQPSSLTSLLSSSGFSPHSVLSSPSSLLPSTISSPCSPFLISRSVTPRFHV